MPRAFAHISFVNFAAGADRLGPGPSPIRLHNNALSGNLRHNIVITERAQDSRQGCPLVCGSLLVTEGLLHDAAKVSRDHFDLGDRRFRGSGHEYPQGRCAPEAGACGFDGYHPHLGHRTYVTGEFRI